MANVSESGWNSYSWHQSHDQATVLLMVPYDVQDEDMHVIIDRNYLVAGVRGRPPSIKGRLYAEVDATVSMWQLEPQTSRLSGRERTTSTTSTNSTHSSFALISDYETSSFAVSLESSQASDTDDIPITSTALSSPGLTSGDDQRNYPYQRSYPRSGEPSQPASPRRAFRSMTSSFTSSIDSLHQSGRLLTLHLEKEKSIIWPSLIVGPCPVYLAPLTEIPYPPETNPSLEYQYNMDPTSLVLIASDLLDIRNKKEEAFEYFSRSWQIAHLPSAAMKLVSAYLPLQSTADMARLTHKQKPKPGTTAYYVKSLGGATGLARLYLEVGLLYLDGSALNLLSASHSSLSSLRLPHQSEITIGGSESWRRDRQVACQLFDQARTLDDTLEIPTLPPLDDLLINPTQNLEMPSVDLREQQSTTIQRRKKRKEEVDPIFDGRETQLEEISKSWYVHIPGLVGAGTALVVVGVIGALSFSTWSRRNQGS